MTKEKTIEKNPTENPMRTYVDALALEAEVVLPEDEMEEYKTKVEELFTRRLGVELLNELDEKGLADYDKLTSEGGSKEEVETFFSSRIENYEEKVKKILEDFRKDYLVSFKK